MDVNPPTFGDSSAFWQKTFRDSSDISRNKIGDFSSKSHFRYLLEVVIQEYRKCVEHRYLAFTGIDILNHLRLKDFVLENIVFTCWHDVLSFAEEIGFAHILLLQMSPILKSGSLLLPSNTNRIIPQMRYL